MFIYRKVNIVKISILLNLIYRFNVIPIKILSDFSEKLISWFKNVYGNSKHNSEKKKKAAGILPVFENYECTLMRQCDIHRHSNETD